MSFNNEKRFFLNCWMSKELSSKLSGANSDAQRQKVCRAWLQSTSLYKSVSNKAIIEQFTDLNCDFAVNKQKFNEKKLNCFLELMNFVLTQMVDHKLSEDDTYECFKDHLLRHAVQRPPFSLAVFSLTDVKAIDLFVQDTLFRHHSMYTFALTSRTMLSMETKPVMNPGEPQLVDIDANAQEIPARDLDVIYQYLTEDERAEFERQKDYMLNGAGRIESIVDKEMEKLYANMQEQIAKQDAEFIAKLPTKK